MQCRTLTTSVILETRMLHTIFDCNDNHYNYYTEIYYICVCVCVTTYTPSHTKST